MLALGVARALAERPELFAELALLLVTDEEWRTHGVRPRRALRRLRRVPVLRGGRAWAARARRGSWSAARRPARCGSRATGRPSHSGSAPDQGANALLALAQAAGALAGQHEPHGAGPPERRARPCCAPADAFNVVPGDRRAGVRPARRPARGLRAGARLPCRPSSTASRSSGSDGAGMAGDGLARAPPRGLLERAAAAGSDGGSSGRGTRRRERREPLRAGDPAHGRRARTARRRRPHAGGVRARRRRCASAPRWRWRSPSRRCGRLTCHHLLSLVDERSGSCRPASRSVRAQVPDPARGPRCCWPGSSG